MKQKKYFISLLLVIVFCFAIAETGMTAALTYFDKNGREMTEPTLQEIEELAVMRTYSDGTVEYALKITHDFSGAMGSGYLENIGNPSPSIGKHWYKKGVTVKAVEVDAIVNDVYNMNSRLVASGYSTEGVTITESKTLYLKFDGENDYITIEGIDLSKYNDLKILFDVYHPESFTKTEYVFSYGDNIYAGFEFNNNCYTFYDQEDYERSPKGLNAFIDKFHTWENTYSVDKRKLWIQKDGNVLSSTTTQHTVRFPNKGSVHIGKKGDAYFFKGYLKNFIINAGPDYQVIVNLPLDDVKGSATARDISGNNYKAVLNNFDTNSAWVQSGSSGTSSSTEYTFPSNPGGRQKVPEFVMEKAVEIVYKWDREYTVQVDTNYENVRGTPKTVINGVTNYGSDKWWAKSGSLVILSSNTVDVFQLDGYRDNASGTTYPDSAQKYIGALDSNINLTWMYTANTYSVSVTVGNPVSFDSLPTDVRSSLVTTAAPVMKTDTTTAAQTTTVTSTYWDERGKKLYPLIGGKDIVMNWSKTDGTTLPIKIAASWPSSPHYIHVAVTPPVPLDPNSNDEFAFKELKYTEGDGAVSQAMEFTATKAGKSTLLFTRKPGGVAAGDLNTEDVYIRVVDTRAWNKDMVSIPAVIGQEITSGNHDSGVPHNGYVYWEMAKYNPNFYSRQTMQGQIFPVNQEFTPSDTRDDMLVIWYNIRDNISWPWKPVLYNCTYPSAPPRIVIAGCQGSEGKDSSGKDQTYPDKNGTLRNWFDPARYTGLSIYHQPDPFKPGYNPNEEHALIKPSFRHADAAPVPMAVFALRNDLNKISHDFSYTSDAYVLIQYYDNTAGKNAMAVFKVEKEDIPLGYVFSYLMEAGKPVVAPYPLNEVIGAAPPSEIFGKNGEPAKRCYWEDHKGQGWAVSGNSFLYSYFWYPLDPSFWYNRDDNRDGEIEGPGDPVPWLPVGYVGGSDGFPGNMLGRSKAVEVIYHVTWPEQTPVLKAGETLTFKGGEYRADNTTYPGLPEVLGWAAGQVVYDDLNKNMNFEKTFTHYLVRLAQVLEERSVPLKTADIPETLQPAGGNVDVIMGFWYFKDLPSGLKKRIFYDQMTQTLRIRGFVNDKTVGDKTLTAAPPSVYAVQPNIMSDQELQLIQDLKGATQQFKDAAKLLWSKSRNPVSFEGENDKKYYTVGLDYYEDSYWGKLLSRAQPIMALGPGLALMPNGALLDTYDSPDDPDDDPYVAFNEGYVTLAENNNPLLGALPVALHVIKVKKDLYRGAIKTINSDNVFDEKISLRHTADFGANPSDVVFQWWYREDDGTTQKPPNTAPEGIWKIFPGIEPEISVAGAGKATLVDNLFFCRYRYKHSDPDKLDSWSNWAGAANSRPPKDGEDPADTYQAQLAEGWVKRVVNGINPFEARVSNFYNSDSPATYVSMIQEAGTRFEGAVPFNPAKDVVENMGLIELYQTVLNRAMDLSINLSQPALSSGVVTAMILAASRIAGFYTLLGNEAYNDALDPTIGFGTSSVEYGSLAPTIFSFQNQVATLLEEELALLRGRDEEGARPVYNRLLWNFTKGEGEAAYALSYNIQDVDKNGFIDEADGRATYPQGHGDAWGHYLTALKGYYDLMGNPYFNWESRSEHFQIEGVVLNVDYFDERKFAEIAAAKAKAGKEIVNLTYREKYVEDPDGQWQGYKDTNTDRSWGVTGWSRKAGMGSLFDWATANLILPSEDPEHTGLKKIDRSTVPELLEIASQARYVQQEYDQSSTGLNPLGLATEAVPFDIDPSALKPGESGTTHFEQVFARASAAMENAQAVFNYANDLKNRIRGNSNDAQTFTEQVDNQDRDYRNRLIEIFGTPYEGTIGTGKVYPPGYQGPDYFLYNYIDQNEVSDKTVPPPSSTFKAYFKPMNEQFMSAEGKNFDDLTKAYSHFFKTDLKEDDFTGVMTQEGAGKLLEIEFPMSASKFSFQAPADWEMRRSPGEIQQALIGLVKAETDLLLTIDDYNNLLVSLDAVIADLTIGSDLNADKMKIENSWLQTSKTMSGMITSLRMASKVASFVSDQMASAADTVIEAIPKIVGMATDATSVSRATVKGAAVGAEAVISGAALAGDISADGIEVAKGIKELEKEINLQKADYKYEVQQKLKEIEEIMGNEAHARLEIFNRKQSMEQASEKYRSVLGKGLRLMEERKAFNAKVAAKTQGKRYMDMAFRLNMNNALSKYRNMFDLAARYVYLAGKAYDYETNLSDRDPASAKALLTSIVKQRTLGQYAEGNYVIGHGGLGDIMGQMQINFAHLKTQMGFNNPQNETDRISLRKELFRIKADAANDALWSAELKKLVVNDLWAVPEFRKFCRPFAPESSGFQPGIVIPFKSNIIFGKGFFGFPLGGGDHAYDPTNFATKVRSVGLWFDGYDDTLLSEAPRAYLIPTGTDIMLVPDSTNMDTREWTIVDQKLPVPLPVSNSNLNNTSWIPCLDGLDGSMIQIRKYSSFRAYHDKGYFNASEMSYDSRLIGRSVWNTRWMLIIPGGTFHYDQKLGVKTFIEKVKDIRLFFQTYAISGN